MKKSRICALVIAISVCACGCGANLTNVNVDANDAGGENNNDITLGGEPSVAAEDAANANMDAIPEGTEFSFLDGKMTAYISEDKYDVLTVDTPADSQALMHQGLDKDRADLYMSACGYALVAVPVGEKLGGSEKTLKFNIKDPKYEGIDALADLSSAEEETMASACVSGFDTIDPGYEMVTYDGVDWFVFNCDMGISQQWRAATIIDERMIYIIVAREGGVINSEDKEELLAVTQNIRWKH